MAGVLLNNPPVSAAHNASLSVAITLVCPYHDLIARACCSVDKTKNTIHAMMHRVALNQMRGACIGIDNDASKVGIANLAISHCDIVAAGGKRNIPERRRHFGNEIFNDDIILGNGNREVARRHLDRLAAGVGGREQRDGRRTIPKPIVRGSERRYGSLLSPEGAIDPDDARIGCPRRGPDIAARVGPSQRRDIRAADGRSRLPAAIRTERNWRTRAPRRQWR